MAVTARFFVAEVHKYPNRSAGWANPASLGKIVMRPALNSEANKLWASATPAGQIEMTIRGEALPWFEERLGVDVAITFEDVPEA